MAAGGAIVAASKDMASNLDVVDKASQRMNIAAESYQELAHAADLSGVSMSTMEKAAKSLVGTDINFDDAMNQIMSLGSESERTAAAVEMFGEKVAYDMQPLLKAGGDAFADMKQEAHDLGLVIDQDTVTAGASLNDMFSKVSASTKALKTGLMTELMPYVASILQWVIDNMPVIQKTIKALMDAILPIVKPVIDTIMQMLPPILEAVTKVANAIIPVITPVLNGISSAVSALIKLLHGDISGFGEDAVKTIGSFGEAFKNAGKALFGALWDGLKEKWDNVMSWVSEKVEWIKEKFTGAQNSVPTSSGVNGKHASGLNYVPYDGYIAELHKGEKVLTANEASKDNRQNNTYNFSFSSPKAINAREAQRLFKSRWFRCRWGIDYDYDKK